ncbi:Uncharacterised protein [Vibrio cholerae]|nr:Uncharacterised protein [Vibrio cholerae]
MGSLERTNPLSTVDLLLQQRFRDRVECDFK